MKEIVFPKNFLWGGAVSAEQTEGKGSTKKGVTIYEHWYQKNPEDFFGQVGPGITSDIMNHYKEDIKMWKEFGHNSHRTSISWARIFPEGDFTKPNLAAVKWYHDFLDELIKNGLTPILTLFHFDMPILEENKGGWESREVWQDFLSYAKFVLIEFAPKVKLWTTMNEPWVPVHNGYLSNIMYPKKNSDQSGVNAAYGVVMAHALVVNFFNKEIKTQFEAEIGAIFNCTFVYPRDKNNLADVKAAKYLNLFQFIGMTDPMINGQWNPESIAWVKEMDLFPENYQKGDKAILKTIQLDWIGLNYYSPQRAKAPEHKNHVRKFLNYFEPYNMPNRRENKFRGWEIYPEAIFDTMQEMVKRYGRKKYMLTEYGMGVENEGVFRNKKGMIDDQYRIAFCKEHLEQLHKAMVELKINVIGAHMWATYDCWSWANAYKNRYGYFEIDLKTQQRIPKASAYFLQSLAKTNKIKLGYQKMEAYMDFDKLKFSKSVVTKLED